MPVAHPPSAPLVCPLCATPAAATGCAACRLSLRDMVAAPRRPRTRAAVGFLHRLLVAGAVYGGITVWGVWKLPALVPFLVPGAILALLVHVLRKRPLVAAVLFFLVVVVLPPLLLPSLTAGWWADLRG